VKPFTGRGILLDIEGTTSSISFVHDVMFPYVRQHLSDYLERHWDSREMDTVRSQIARDDGCGNWDIWLQRQHIEESKARQAAEAQVLRLMDGDVKATGLKTLQGLIWENGFRSGELKSHVYDDVLPAVEAWRARGWDVRIYSSGSVAAQRLFFGHVVGRGDCLKLFSGYYDTTIGSKREAASYLRIAQDWGLPPGDILFISDLEAELAAAAAAGLQVAASVRPGNAPLSDAAPWPRLTSFADVAG
jgi:enolase-phosphatase E1